MFEQAFKNIDDVLWKDAGCTSELDYTEQTSWLLFLKYLDALEHDKATEAALDGRKYTHILDKPYRWESWAAPRSTSSRQASAAVSLSNRIDHNTALTGDDLIQFVNAKLFPYLHGFKAKATGPNTIEYKIGEIFGEIKNRIQSGYNLREIIDHIALQRMACFVPASGSVSSNQSGAAKILRALIEAKLVDRMVALSSQLLCCTKISVFLCFREKYIRVANWSAACKFQLALAP